MTAIAFEGTVYSGKTTLARIAAQSTGFLVVPEYAPVGNSDAGTDVQKAWHIQQQYLVQEHQRALGPKNQILLDRSIISLATHTALIYALYDIDIRSQFMQKFEELNELENIILPDALIIVSASREMLLHRRDNDIGRNTPAPLIEERYCAGVQNCAATAANYLPTLYVDTTEKFVADAVTDFILKIKRERQTDAITAVQEIISSSAALRRTLRR